MWSPKLFYQQIERNMFGIENGQSIISFENCLQHESKKYRKLTGEICIEQIFSTTLTDRIVLESE